MLARQRDEVERETTAAVAYTLNDDTTWREIDEALGLPKVTAQRRYGPLLVAERRWRVRDEEGPQPGAPPAAKRG
jgi:hypothetical protein